MKPEDFKTLVTYLPQELKDRPNYVQRRNEELQREVVCVAVAGPVEGLPWHPRMGLVSDHENGLFQVVFDDDNADELELLQSVQVCSPHRPEVMVKGEWAGLATVVYSKSTWEDGYYAADRLGPVRPVLRRARLVLLENVDADTVLTPTEYRAWLANHPEKQRSLNRCAAEKVSGYREKLGSREARRAADWQAIKSSTMVAPDSEGAKVIRLLAQIDSAQAECGAESVGPKSLADRLKPRSRCGDESSNELAQSRRAVLECAQSRNAGGNCATNLARAELAVQISRLETTRPQGWKEKRDTLLGKLRTQRPPTPPPSIF